MNQQNRSPLHNRNQRGAGGGFHNQNKLVGTTSSTDNNSLNGLNLHVQQ